MEPRGVFPRQYIYFEILSRYTPCSSPISMIAQRGEFLFLRILSV